MQERQVGDSHIVAADEQHQMADGVVGGKRARQRQVILFGQELVGIDVPVVELLLAPLVLGLPVNGAAAFQGDVINILGQEQRPPLFVKAGGVLAGIDRRAGLDVEAHVTA